MFHSPNMIKRQSYSLNICSNLNNTLKMPILQLFAPSQAGPSQSAPSQAASSNPPYLLHEARDAEI